MKFFLFLFFFPFPNRVARVYSHVPTAEQSTRGALSARAHVGTFLVTFPRYFFFFFSFFRLCPKLFSLFRGVSQCRHIHTHEKVCVLLYRLESAIFLFLVTW